MATREPSPFGALLQRDRAAAGLTQEQLAARARLSADAIAALEQGRRRTPRAASIHLLADALGLADTERQALLAAARPSARGRGADGRARATPPPSRSSSLPSRLAAQPTPLVDRADELETIRRRLAGDGAERARLLTLVGPGGVGKTRLALAVAADAQVAAHFPDGVMFVELTPLRDPSLVLGTIGRALGLTDAGPSPLPERLRDFLRERATLLVLDSFEQVLQAAADLADLLAACPRLALLTTSRFPLHLRWEHTLRVAPLAVPDVSAALPPLDELARVPAVALFLARARARRADFALTAANAPLVAQLVAQLDGVPLALELAAARLDALPLATIVGRLGDRLRLLRWEAPDVPERQRSLAASLDWSYELLGEGERRLFRHVGVFRARVALDAIAAVVAGAGDEEGAGADEDGEPGETGEPGRADEGRILDGLISLTEKSLLLRERERDEVASEGEADEDPEPAFGMLETMREYAEEQLARLGELPDARARHAHYFLALAERAAPLLRRRDQLAWFFRLEREHDNLRAALWWLLDQDAPAEREAALRLAVALSYFWRRRGYLAEGAGWLQEALRRAPQADPALRTRALLATGAMLVERGDLGRAQAVLEEALALARERQAPADIAEALTDLGACAVAAGDAPQSARLLHEARARWEGLGDPDDIGRTLFYLGLASRERGDDAEAAALEAAGLGRLESAGNTRTAGIADFGLALAVRALGDLPRAVRLARAGIEIAVAYKDRWLLGGGARATLVVLGEHVDPERRARLLGASDALGQATGATLGMWERPLADPGVAALREGVERGEWGEAYREGRALPFAEVAALALAMVDDVARTLAGAPDGGEGATPQPTRGAGPLSAREAEALRLVAEGLPNKAIGRRLFISAHTVNYHLTSIFRKLGVDTRAQAVAVATQRGLL